MSRINKFQALSSLNATPQHGESGKTKSVTRNFQTQFVSDSEKTYILVMQVHELIRFLAFASYV